VLLIEFHQPFQSLVIGNRSQQCSRSSSAWDSFAPVGSSPPAHKGPSLKFSYLYVLTKVFAGLCQENPLLIGPQGVPHSGWALKPLRQTMGHASEAPGNL
jgi:hypothetical protein